jgi:microcystin-dependent protein
MAIKITKADLFDPAADINSRGYKKNALTDGEPDQSLVENWVESTAWKTEDGDRATQSTGGEPVEDLKGLVQVGTDAEAKANTTGLEATTTKVPHTGQLPTVDANESQTVGALTDNLLEVTTDGGVTTRNNFLLKLKEGFRAWLDTLRSDVDTNTSDIATLSGGLGDSIPVGNISMHFGGTAPSDWLLADGATLGSTASAAANNNDDYEILWKLLWDNSADIHLAVSGGRGASASADWDANKTITLPNYAGRTPVGYDSSDADFDDLGGSGGYKTVALSASNMPDHTHNAGASGNTGSGGGSHTHQYNFFDEFVAADGVVADPNNTNVVPRAGRIVGGNPIVDVILENTNGPNISHTHTVSGGATGNVNGGAGGSNVNIVNPYSTINFIIKY